MTLQQIPPGRYEQNIRVDDEQFKVNDEGNDTLAVDNGQLDSVFKLTEKIKLRNILDDEPIKAETRGLKWSNKTLNISMTFLLIQFTNLQVRGNSISGSFIRSINSDMLLLIEQMQCHLLPGWQAEYVAKRHQNILTSVQTKDCLIYSGCMRTINAIASDDYWHRVTPSEMQPHI